MADAELEPREEGDNRGASSAVARPAGRVDVARALKLRLRGMTFEDIGTLQGVSRQSVEQALKRFGHAVADPDGTRAFRENEAELLDQVASQIVAHMSSPDVIAKASLNNSAFALAKVHEARRLIRGESTANVGIRTTLVLAAHGSGKASDSAELDGD